MDFILTSLFWLFLVILAFVGFSMIAYACNRGAELKPVGRFLFAATGVFFVVAGLLLAHQNSTDERKPADKTVRIIIENRADGVKTEVEQ